MPVYKDECVYTFDSVESPQGIDVCLECKLAFSPAKGFSSLHTALTSHDSFVNIRKTARDRPSKQIKLAIDSQSDADLWETHTKVITGSMDPADAEKLAKQVMEADSYNKQQEIVAWELEIKECNHSKELSQERGGYPSSATHCSQCELDNNLWMCLSCGALSCGRQQFGGGGGNGHALVHFDATKHPLAVKLGSITPEGHADVFCYACDDEVKDPQIKAHLATFGVDIASAQKTEKSMAELQLEQNAKFDFSMHDQDGKDLEPVSGPGLTGMRNLGNTCYLNSVVQCLMALKGFSEYFPGNTTTNVLESQDPPNDLNIQLCKLQDGLNSGDYAIQDPHSEMGYQRGVTPAMFKHLVGKDHPEFATMRQQDAYEFLSHLFTKISQATAKDGKPDPVSALFGFETNRRIQCLKCGSVKYKSEPQESLSIQVPIEREGPDSALKPVSFDQLLKVETAPETIQLDCPVCGEKQDMNIKSGLKSYPKNFILNVRRFELVNWVPQKVDVPVEVPTDINLKPYQVQQVEGETIMQEKEDEAAAAFEPNREVLDQLTAMGFPYEKCVQALESTGNSDPEAAMNWLLLPEELQVKPPARKSGTRCDPEQIETLGAMGFTPIQAEAALKVNNNNVEAAVEWLFAGNAENAEKFLDTTERPQSLGDDGPTNYKLKGIICHKGGSVHAGHYVAFVEREGNWYLYNDEKVVKGADIKEMQKFAYLYIFERK